MSETEWPTPGYSVRDGCFGLISWCIVRDGCFRLIPGYIVRDGCFRLIAGYIDRDECFGLIPRWRTWKGFVIVIIIEIKNKSFFVPWGRPTTVTKCYKPSPFCFWVCMVGFGLIPSPWYSVRDGSFRLIPWYSVRDGSFRLIPGYIVRDECFRLIPGYIDRDGCFGLIPKWRTWKGFVIVIIIEIKNKFFCAMGQADNCNKTL